MSCRNAPDEFHLSFLRQIGEAEGKTIHWCHVA
jgi:hypothetical protein